MNGARKVIEFDESHWPVLVIRFSGQPSDDEFVAYLRHYDDVLVRAHWYAVLYVTERGMPMTKARHARMQAQWMKDKADAIRRVCAGVGFVLPSPLMRGVLRAIFKMAPMLVPYVVVEEEAEGLAWARAQLSAGPVGDASDASGDMA